MKTGTTYLQGRAYANRDALAECGVTLPGAKWNHQVWATQELLGMNTHDPELVRRNAGWWQRIADQMRTTPGTSLLTMEFLAFANRSVARRAIESLEGAEVHVVLTVRDAAAVVPALWQTTVTSGGTMTWARFRAAFRASARGRGAGAATLSRVRLPSAVRFQEALNIARMLRVWTSVLPAEQVHVVVVPGPDAPRDRLWEMFCGVLGVEASRVPLEADNPNESLGYPSAELVRRVNKAIDIEHPRLQSIVKDDLGHHTLGLRRDVERRARLDERTLRSALDWNGVTRSAVEETGTVVHGDLADLPVEPLPRHGVEDDQRPPSDAELLDAARMAIRALRKLVRRRAKRRLGEAAGRDFRRALAQRATGPKAWRSSSDPVAAAVADLVLYCEALIELRLVREAKRRARERRR
ncbi:hypothetical protein [Nocardioides montaniterrae]